ncbi:MAG: RluA family pseudouridine synthase [Erysipelotrichaceae bacterium]|nr:RluA family pseudouridine synthase [Erysipelotrichaceae bacterium]
MNIIYEDNHLLVVEKPVNIPVQADDSNDPDLLTMLKDYLKEKYDKPGNVYLGLVHRLDRPVGGVMVFAKTSKAASRLSKVVAERKLQKTYLAVVEGNNIKKKDTLDDYLIKNSKTNTVTVTSQDKGKHASLDYELLNTRDNLNLVKVNLHTGRSHQIRVQFSSRNMPLWGDQRYNKNAKIHQQIALWSHILSFPHPITKEVLTFTSEPPNNYPWNELMPDK